MTISWPADSVPLYGIDKLSEIHQVTRSDLLPVISTTCSAESRIVTGPGWRESPANARRSLRQLDAP
jgi:hypothetical protein